MADTELDYALGFVDKRRTQGQSNSSLATPLNYTSTNALRARLTTINSGYFTAALLNTMTRNDMVMAIRINDDSGGI